MVKKQRLSWDLYFIDIMRSVANRATCDRGKSGAVLVKDNNIIATGYVGSPRGLPHCDDIGHLFKETIHQDGHQTKHCIRTIHAEMNAICQAAVHGVSTVGSTMYCKMTPCMICAMLIINCHIIRVVAEFPYQAGEESIKMFKEVGVEFICLNNQELY